MNPNATQRFDARENTFIKRVWQDREIRFDVSPSMLKCRHGEVEIDSINSVEDTKGNNGHKGFLVVTNLRLIWCSHTTAYTNLSIGYNCVTGISIKNAKSKLKGSQQALYILSKFRKGRYEFVFTSLVNKSPRLFTTVQAVVRAYETSKSYRDLKLRAAIIRDHQLVQVPDEQIYNHEQGIWNLSSDQGNLGAFFLTNIRIVWHARLSPNFNVSIPYLQIKALTIRKSKFGMALVIETRQEAGGYLLGFRVDPSERLQEIYQAITSLYRVFATKPNFGIRFEVEEKPKTPLESLQERVEDKVEIVDNADDAMESLSAYYADHQGPASDKEIVYNEDLGLAIEKLPEGFTPQNLWLLY
jgi:Bardet-Biedl syndrome 5 protein